MPRRILIVLIVFLIQSQTTGCGALNAVAVQQHKNEEAAIRLLGQLRTFEAEYASKSGGEYADFGELRKGLGYRVPDLDATPVLDGYVFKITVTEPSPERPAYYAIHADPEVSSGFRATGTRHFYMDSTLGTVRETRENRPATASDPSVPW